MVLTPCSASENKLTIGLLLMLSILCNSLEHFTYLFLIKFIIKMTKGMQHVDHGTATQHTKTDPKL